MMPSDASYYLLDPNSLQVRIATQQRRVMYRAFVERLCVGPQSSILDVGVTSDRTFENSNYLEAWHPYPANITALGIDDASFLETLYKGLRFVRGSGLDMSFAAKSFDFVHCSAVIEHVGCDENQQRLIFECARVAKLGFFITTPNRWFPIEVHTSLPFLHWLPNRWHRPIFSRLGYEFYSREENLNLMDATELRKMTANLRSYNISISRAKLWGVTSNLLLVGQSKG
jgi:ubiquinone/menaquinone biosynthesis C-methylase UbiE